MRKETGTGTDEGRAVIRMNKGICCPRCGKLLFRGNEAKLEIQCPKCKCDYEIDYKSGVMMFREMLQEYRAE